jgi:hypothetical protein
MKSLAKHVVRSLVHRIGYDLVRAAPPNHLKPGAPHSARNIVAELAQCEALREIHCNDAKEIEELYRHFVFPDLPKRDGRAKMLNDLIGTSVGEAIYIVHNLHKALSVEGDVCEFGVAQGATSRLLASEILAMDDRQLWLFDSFKGLPDPSPEDRLVNDIFNLGSMQRYKGKMASSENEVRTKLQAIEFPPRRTRIKKGWVNDVLQSEDLPSRVAFAYVDFDFYEPIAQTLSFLDSRMLPGARIVVDDYGYFSEGAQLAVDQFVSRVTTRYKFELPLSFAGYFCVLHKVA